MLGVLPVLLATILRNWIVIFERWNNYVFVKLNELPVVNQLIDQVFTSKYTSWQCRIKPKFSMLSYLMYGGVLHEKWNSNVFILTESKQYFGRCVNVGDVMVEKIITWGVLKQKSRDGELQA